jgi:hypothetical protein
MKREDDEQLWDLLAHNREPAVSPFFARNVLRRIREEQPEPRKSWLSWRRLVPASGLAVALAVAGAVVLVHYQAPEQESGAQSQVDPVIASIDAQDYDVVADLDNLLASDENSPWDENSTL